MTDCKRCYVSHVGHSYIVINCAEHGGASYTVPIDEDDDYDDDEDTEPGSRK